jgi:transposase
MRLHRNAKLGLAGRFALVQAREQGLSTREVGGRFSVSPATVCRWHRRWRQAREDERSTLACLLDRSSRPRRMPRLLPASAQSRICAARRRSGWGPRLLTVRTGYPHSTISKVLRRHGLSRPPRAPREPARRYEWPCPGDLLHADWTPYARFEPPGHAVTGDRSSTAAERRRRVGYDYAHAVVDDHSRLGYAELLPDTKALTVTGFLERALAFFAGHGIESRRLMTDNHWSYTRNRSLRQLLAARGVKHVRTPKRPSAAEREGRALPPDDGPRVGLRRPLPLLSTPGGGTATLARLLQRAQTAQLARRPTADQPRSQRLWAGHLDGGRGRSPMDRRLARPCQTLVRSGSQTGRSHTSGHGGCSGLSCTR